MTAFVTCFYIDKPRPRTLPGAAEPARTLPQPSATAAPSAPGGRLPASGGPSLPCRSGVRCGRPVGAPLRVAAPGRPILPPALADATRPVVRQGHGIPRAEGAGTDSAARRAVAAAYIEQTGDRCRWLVRWTPARLRRGSVAGPGRPLTRGNAPHPAPRAPSARRTVMKSTWRDVAIDCLSHLDCAERPHPFGTWVSQSQGWLKTPAREALVILTVGLFLVDHITGRPWLMNMWITGTDIHWRGYSGRPKD